MERNFFRRIETCTPIEDPVIKARVIYEGLTLALQDNQQAWLMQGDGSYVRATPTDGEPIVNLQLDLLEKYSHQG